jgi:hypothetical protein
MRKVGGAIVLVLAALVLACVQEMRPAHRISGFTEQDLSAARESPAENLLDNPDFEGGTTKAALYWTPDGGPYAGSFEEINCPEGWICWWREGFDCAFCGGGPCTFQTGRPEVTLTTDPHRIFSSAKAVKAFTFFRCHQMGLQQQVCVEAGRYVFQIAAHAWYTNCSSKPFTGPLSSDCKTPLSARDLLRVGIDPTGGIDPLAPSVTWGNDVEQYGVYGLQPLSVIVNVPENDTITVFVESLADTPNKHCDTYWDDASLWRIEGETYLPLVLSQHAGD